MFSFSNIDRYIVSVALLLIALSSRQPLDGLVAFEGGAECFNTKNKVFTYEQKHYLSYK